MAVSAASLAVADTEVALNTAGSSSFRLVVHNTGGQVADLGPTGVTLGAGFELAVGSAPVVVELEPGDVLFAISNVTGTTIKVLRT